MRERPRPEKTRHPCRDPRLRLKSGRIGTDPPGVNRLDHHRQLADTMSVHGFALQCPTPALLLRYVVEGDLTQHRGPEGTMRHSQRRTLTDQLNKPVPPGRRKVGTERIASVRAGPDAKLASNYLIGRDTRCDVLLNDYTISAEHARLHHIPQIHRWMIEDLGSTNHSFVNGTQLPPMERSLLTSLDEVQLGRMVFLYLEPKDLYEYLKGNF